MCVEVMGVDNVGYGSGLCKLGGGKSVGVCMGGWVDGHGYYYV